MPQTALLRMRKDAEIVVKHRFGIGSAFDAGMAPYYGIAVFANRRGYRFLSEYFAWLAEREHEGSKGASDTDPGDHAHLTPTSNLSDEIDFSFDTITPNNRSAVLRNAQANKRSRRRGTPFRQLAEYCRDSIQFFTNSWLKNDPALREFMVNDLTASIATLQAALQSLTHCDDSSAK